jgi:hypothetical protein
MAEYIRTCSENGCDRTARKRGLCNTHYERLRRAGAFEIREKNPIVRLWARIEKNGPIPTYRPDLGRCWIWQGATTSGYGRVYFDGRVRPVHHVVWSLTVGAFPEGMEPDHLCRVRACCNPAHLEPVTQRINLMRGASPSASYARRSHCDAGHPLEGPDADIYTPSDHPTWRLCRKCRGRNSLNSQRKSRASRVVTTACIVCGTEFSYNGKRRKICSADCRTARTRQISRDFQRAKRSAS